VHITHHRGLIDRRQVELLWSLHSSESSTWALGPGSPSIHRSEFDNLVGSETNRLWVLHDDTRPVATALVSTEETFSRVLSRAYFQRRFPAETAAGGVHTLMWFVVHRDYGNSDAAVRLARSIVELQRAEGAVLVLDGSAMWLDELGQLLADTATTLGLETTVDQVERQTHYAVDFDLAEVAPEGVPAVRLKAAV
jgi:hypothetical protein